MDVVLSTHGSRGDVEPMVDSRCSWGYSARRSGCAPPDCAELPGNVGLPLVPIGVAVARLQLARALALSGDTVKAKSAYAIS